MCWVKKDVIVRRKTGRGGLLLSLLRDACLRVVEGGKHLTVYLPFEVWVPFIDFVGYLQGAEHELLQWGKLYLLDEETLAEVSAAR